MRMWFGFISAVNFCHFSTLLTLSFFAGATSTSPKFDLYFVTFPLCYVPHRRGGGHIVFGADPVGVGVSVGFSISVSVTLSCLHDIS